MSKSRDFYWPQFTASERRCLAEIPQDSAGLLEAEIDILRVSIKRIFKIAKTQTDENAVRTLCLLSSVTGRLASLIRTQAALKSGKSGVSELDLMLENILAEVTADWVNT